MDRIAPHYSRWFEGGFFLDKIGHRNTLITEAIGQSSAALPAQARTATNNLPCQLESSLELYSLYKNSDYVPLIYSIHSLKSLFLKLMTLHYIFVLRRLIVPGNIYLN